MTDPKILYTHIKVYIETFVNGGVEIAEPRSLFRSNFIKVASANAFAQALPIVVAPILTRLYLPSDFGTSALFAALFGVISAFATMRIDWLVSTVKNDKSASNIFIVGIIHVILVSIIICMIKLFSLHKFVSFVKWQLIDNYLWLLPVALVGAGIQIMLSGWFVRMGNLSPIAASTIRQSLGGTSINVMGGILSSGAGGLIVSASVNPWLGVITLSKRANQSLEKYQDQLTLLSIYVNFKNIFKKYIVSGLTGIVNTCGLLLPTLLISVYFTSTELGWYALMQRLATGPIGILTGALGQSFWAEARRLAMHDPVRLKKLFLKTTKHLALISLFVSIICLAGPLYIGPIFGMEKWAGAGVILAALTPFVVSQIVVSTLSSIIVIYGEENWLFFWDLIRTILIVSVFVLSDYYSLQFVNAIRIFSIIMFFMYIVLFLKNLKLLSIACETA